MTIATNDARSLALATEPLQRGTLGHGALLLLFGAAANSEPALRRQSALLRSTTSHRRSKSTL
jgi:hypothetical protein